MFLATKSLDTRLCQWMETKNNKYVWKIIVKKTNFLIEFHFDGFLKHVKKD